MRVYAVGNLPGPAAEFTVPPNHTSTSSQDVLIHHAELGPQDFRETAGLPVTSPGRTLADIAAAGSTDLEGLGRIATNLLQRRLATQAELSQALETLELPGAYETASAVLGQIASNQRYGRPDDYILQYKARNEAIGAADVAKAAATLSPSSLTWVVVGDLSKVGDSVRALQLGEAVELDADGNIKKK